MNQDSSKLYAPGWVKLISLMLLVTAFSLAAWVVVKYMDENRHDWILVAISLAQIALTGIVFLLIYFFSERDHSTTALRKMSDKFISKEVMHSLEKIELHLREGEFQSPKITVAKDWTGIFGKVITISCGNYEAHLWVGMNVNKIWCIYTFDDFTCGQDPSGTQLREKLRPTTEGAEQTGYNVNITYLKHNENEPKGTYSVWATVSDKDHPFMLSNAHRRLFFANDIAMMTHSMLNTAYREGVTPSKKLPTPL